MGWSLSNIVHAAMQKKVLAFATLMALSLIFQTSAFPSNSALFEHRLFFSHNERQEKDRMFNGHDDDVNLQTESTVDSSVGVSEIVITGLPLTISSKATRNHGVKLNALIVSVEAVVAVFDGLLCLVDKRHSQGINSTIRLSSCDEMLRSRGVEKIELLHGALKLQLNDGQHKWLSPGEGL